jgi:hypothetical protein
MNYHVMESVIAAILINQERHAAALNPTAAPAAVTLIVMLLVSTKEREMEK